MNSGFIWDIEPPKGARVRVISDLHYGHRKSEAPAPAQLVASMQGVDVLIIAGDCAETHLPEGQKEGRECLQQLLDSCAEAGIQLITLAGNHDPDQGPQMLRLWQGQCVIIHGHQLFEGIAPWSWEYIGNKKQNRDFIEQYPQRHSDLNQALQLAQNLSKYRCQHLLAERRKTGIRVIDHMLHCFWPPERPYNIVKAWLSAGRRAEAFARQFTPQAKTLIFGHVHRHGTWKKGARTLYTTGAWFQHAKAFYVDLQDGQVIDYHSINK